MRKQLLKEAAAKAEIRLEQALIQYEQYQRMERKNKDRTVGTEIDRVKRFLGRNSGALPRFKGQEEASAAYKALRERLTQYGRPPSDADQQACLKAARRFGKWLVKQRLWRDNPLTEVEMVGRAKRGEESKPQHRIDEARRLIFFCLDLGEHGDAGAIATLCGELLGMRATAIATRQVRDLDANGTILHTEGKTPSGRVPLSLVGRDEDEEVILSKLRRVLALQAVGKAATAPLVGSGHDRFWVRRQAHRLCKLAGVPVITAHALRGTHTSAAYEEGESPAMVARSIGHAGVQVGQRHYATQASQTAGRQRRALRGLVSNTPQMTDQGLTND